MTQPSAERPQPTNGDRRQTPAAAAPRREPDPGTDAGPVFRGPRVRTGPLPGRRPGGHHHSVSTPASFADTQKNTPRKREAGPMRERGGDP